MRSLRVELGRVPGLGGLPLELGLDVLEAGAGGRPLMLVHGFTGAKEDFADHVDALAGRGWQVVAPDLRGHGSSDHPPGEDSYTFDLMAADLLALADSLGWGRFVLAGHSMGGALAQRVALSAPERLEALLLAATYHGPVKGVDPALLEFGMAVVRQAGMPGLAQALAQHRESRSDTEPESSFERLSRERPGYAEWHDAKLLATSSEAWLALAPRFLDEPDRLDALSRLELPTCVVVGELDRTMLEDCRRLARTIPGARLVVIPGAGHSPQHEEPEAWFAAVVSFLDEVASREKAGVTSSGTARS